MHSLHSAIHAYITHLKFLDDIYPSGLFWRWRRIIHGFNFLITLNLLFKTEISCLIGPLDSRKWHTTQWRGENGYCWLGTEYLIKVISDTSKGQSVFLASCTYKAVLALKSYNIWIYYSSTAEDINCWHASHGYCPMKNICCPYYDQHNLIKKEDKVHKLHVLFVYIVIPDCSYCD